MINLIDITSDDIANLNDSDLRDLIGRLCEAEHQLVSLPTTGVTWSGHQDAPNGGSSPPVATISSQ